MSAKVLRHFTQWAKSYVHWMYLGVIGRWFFFSLVRLILFLQRYLHILSKKELKMWIFRSLDSSQSTRSVLWAVPSIALTSGHGIWISSFLSHEVRAKSKIVPLYVRWWPPCLSPFLINFLPFPCLHAFSLWPACNLLAYTGYPDLYFCMHGPWVVHGLTCVPPPHGPT